MQNRCIFVLLKWLWWINYMWRQVQAIGCLSPAEKFFRVKKKRKLSIVDSGENKVNSSALLSEQIEAGSETLDSWSKLLLVLLSGRSVLSAALNHFPFLTASLILWLFASVLRGSGFGSFFFPLEFFFPSHFSFGRGRAGRRRRWRRRVKRRTDKCFQKEKDYADTLLYLMTL